jgi:DNA-directed DNA polymerase III PolC
MYIASRTYYSLRFGTLSPEKLVQIAVSKGIKVMALTDINNSTAMPEFVKACGKDGITPVAGMEFRNGDAWLYTALARNERGFEQINRFMSYHNLNKLKLPGRAPQLDDVFFVYPFPDFPEHLRDNEYIGVRVSERNKLVTISSKLIRSRCVMYHPVTFASRDDMELHRHLRAIDHNLLLSNLTPQMVAMGDEVAPTEAQLVKTYEFFPELVANTQKLLLKCSFQMDFTTSKNKSVYSASRYDDKLLLQKLAREGFQERFGLGDTFAHERLEKELNVIDKLGFAAYFLITRDIVHYSMTQGIYHVGRGSGANSLVAYCLKITDVNPIELNLYFERFINPQRTSPPDFDIDYSWRDRDQVQDYIFKRYGREHTALLGATSTFQGRSILRELGKVQGLPKAEIDLLVNDPKDVRNQHKVAQHILRIGRQMNDFPNLRTIHAGGILISEKPITCYTALDMPPKGYPTTQWDMYTAEKLRFEKLDILSQRGIGHINDCVKLVQQNRGKQIDAHKVEMFKNDARVKKMLQLGETNGCFYIESPAMRGLLRKLRCDNYLTLVAASSIIRPGVAKSGMMREFIKRFQNPDGFEYIHPVMKEQLEETYGVMVYQEDVLKVCHHFAGLDLADADTLRRVMSGKQRQENEMNTLVNKFFTNCRQRGYPEHITNEVWRQIASFAGYSFSKAHSASYAVESFQSLYLKAHYPLEFMVAVINNFGGFYKTSVYFNEALRWGAKIELPCVNHSVKLTTISDKTIHVGFIHVQELEQRVIKSLLHERSGGGEFRSLADFARRADVAIQQLRILIRIGAFRFTGKTKVDLLWEAHMLFDTKKRKELPSPVLFEPEERNFSLPKLRTSVLEDAYDEIELLGFPLSLTWFDMLQTSFRGEVVARNLRQHVGKVVKITGLLVTIKYVWTVKKEVMHFGTFIDYKGNFLDTVHFPDCLKKYPFTGDGVYLILGKVVEEFGHPSIEVQKMARLPLQPDPRNEKQRHAAIQGKSA